MANSIEMILKYKKITGIVTERDKPVYEAWLESQSDVEIPDTINHITPDKKPLKKPKKRVRVKNVVTKNDKVVGKEI